MQNWREENLQEADGIIVGANQDFERFLPWWWHQYSFHNAYPVTFVDFGMSERARLWCALRGEVRILNLPENFVAPIQAVDPTLLLLWKKMYKDNGWNSRREWFKKPFALLQTPYARTIWIDLDCEVRGDLSPLFSLCDSLGGIAVTPLNQDSQQKLLECHLRLPEEQIYSSGVIVYRRHIPPINEWAERSFHENVEFFGDQDILSRVLYERKTVVSPLPDSYHDTATNDPKNVIIQHWGGKEGKQHILKMIQKMSASFPDLRELLLD